MTWTDDTEASYRKWHKEKFGVYPPEVKLSTKEVKMGNEKIENFMPPADTAIVTNPTGEEPMIPKSEPDGGTNELNNALRDNPRRTRRRKGLPEGIEIVTTRTAIIPLHIPERPEGFEKVIIELISHAGKFTIETEIEWPEGATDLQALGEYFFPACGAMKIPVETNGPKSKDDTFTQPTEPKIDPLDTDGELIETKEEYDTRRKLRLH